MLGYLLPTVQAHTNAPVICALGLALEGGDPGPAIDARLEYQQCGGIVPIDRELCDVAATHHCFSQSLVPFDARPDFVGLNEGLREQRHEWGALTLHRFPAAIGPLKKLFSHHDPFADDIRKNRGRVQRGTEARQEFAGIAFFGETRWKRFARQQWRAWIETV